MSNKLFAFNVSKKTEKADEKSKQWSGRAVATAGYCCSQNYGLTHCTATWIGNYYEQCKLSGTTGYYICDGN